jgi:hypothetical protein
MDDSDKYAVLGLLSRTGPEALSDNTDSALKEPTAFLPLVTPPKATGRAVIVYEQEPRPKRALWIFTAIMVALTTGVVLGQTSAYRAPATRSVSAAQTGALPIYETPPVPSAAPTPVPGPPITALRGSAKTRLLEVTGASTSLRIRSVNLGELLFSIGTMDGSAMPGVVETPRGPQLSLVRTGLDATEIQLNSKVRWTIKLAGEATTQQIDMRSGGLAGIELAGASSDTTLELPKPAKTVALRVTGAVGNLQVRAAGDVPVRLRLGKGAETATLDGTQHSNPKSGTVLASRGWQSATKRYDIRTYSRLASVIVAHPPKAQ